MTTVLVSGVTPTSNERVSILRPRPSAFTQASLRVQHVRKARSRSGGAVAARPCCSATVRYCAASAAEYDKGRSASTSTPISGELPLSLPFPLSLIAMSPAPALWLRLKRSVDGAASDGLPNAPTSNVNSAADEPVTVDNVSRSATCAATYRRRSRSKTKRTARALSSSDRQSLASAAVEASRSMCHSRHPAIDGSCTMVMCFNVCGTSR